MRRLRDSVFYLVVHLTILFNIERLDMGGTDVTNLATSVYILTGIATVTILTIKWLKNLQPPVLILMWGFIYMGVKLVSMPNRPLVGDIYTYLTFTELALFSIAVLLTQNLALKIEEFEQAVKGLAYTNVSKISRVETAQEKVQAEIYRSRRFQRPLSIVVFEKDRESVEARLRKIVQDAQRALTEEYISALLVRQISAQLRQTDFLLEHEKSGRWIIVSPDTDSTGINNLIERLKSVTPNSEISIRFGAATFPSHGLTFEQLLEQAEMNLQQLHLDGGLSIKPPEPVEKNQAVNMQ